MSLQSPASHYQTFRLQIIWQRTFHSEPHSHFYPPRSSKGLRGAYTPSLKVQTAPFGRCRHLLSHIKSDQTQIVQATDSVLLLGHWVAKASGRIIHRITTISRAGQSTMNRSTIQVSLQQIESISHLKNRTMVDSNKVPIGKRIFFWFPGGYFPQTPKKNQKLDDQTWYSCIHRIDI